MYGNRALIPDFPDIQMDGIIEHVIHDDDMALAALLTEGQQVVVLIDQLRRARLSLSHTASHLLYLGVMEVRPDAVAATLGCHIRPDAARFDFGIADRFKSEEVTEIERLANALVSRGSAVRVSAHQQYSDARYWECEGNVIPCGGTHIQSTAAIGPMQISRKSLGKCKERLAVNFHEAIFDLRS
jgi:alanyl-tRNA synthetase